MNIQNIKISDIKPDKEQPRKYFDEESLERLKQSIIDNGIEIPLRVKENEKSFIIVDGERRWRACQDTNIKELPCIIDDGENILEKQLRTDCLKEGLTVDELDKAIYKYYEHFSTLTSLNSNSDKKYSEVARKIGKSVPRISKAIDRFEFKRDNKEFTKKIEKEYNPQKKKFSKVNSTISMTGKIKDSEKRKKTIDTILKKRKQKTIETPEIRKIVDKVAVDDVNLEDIEQIVEEKKPDVNIKFEEWLNNFYDIKSDFEMLHFEKAVEHINPNNINKLKRCLENIMTNLTGLEHKFNIKDGKKHAQITQ
jgi:ParB family chromosome partitioning protein